MRGCLVNYKGCSHVRGWFQIRGCVIIRMFQLQEGARHYFLVELWLSQWPNVLGKC